MSRKRRGRSEGAIYRRADGIWCTSVSSGYDGNGKRLRRVLYGRTKREVQEKLKEMHQSANILAAPTRMRLGDYFDYWLENVAKKKVRPNTLASYESPIRVHINPSLGGVKIAKLNKANLSTFYKHLEEKEVGLRTRQMVHVVLHNALGYAAKNEFVNRNVAALMDKPSAPGEKPSKKLNVWNEEEVTKFLQATRDDRLEALYILALTCGFRQGELLGLHRRCVNLKAGTISIEQTLIEVKGKLTLDDPKTKTSRRLVDLPGVAVRGLARHWERMIADGHAGTEWVFCDSQGGPIRKSNLRRRSFKPLLEKAEVPKIRFHDLRHTAATLLLGLRVHPKVVQERLGHSTIRVTLDTYSHVLPSMQKEAVGRLDGMFNALD